MCWSGDKPSAPLLWFCFAYSALKWRRRLWWQLMSFRGWLPLWHAAAPYSHCLLTQRLDGWSEVATQLR